MAYKQHESDPDYIEMTSEEWKAAALKQLDKLGTTYVDLMAKARSRDEHLTTRELKLWMLIRGTLDEDVDWVVCKDTFEDGAE